MKRKTLPNPTQVRIPSDLKRRLESVSARFALPASELVRRAIEWKLPQWEDTGEFIIRSEERSSIRGRAGVVAVAAVLSALIWSAQAPGNVNGPDTMPSVVSSFE